MLELISNIGCWKTFVSLVIASLELSSVYFPLHDIKHAFDTQVLLICGLLTSSLLRNYQSDDLKSCPVTRKVADKGQEETKTFHKYGRRGSGNPPKQYGEKQILLNQ